MLESTLPVMVGLIALSAGTPGTKLVQVRRLAVPARQESGLATTPPPLANTTSRQTVIFARRDGIRRLV